MWAGTEQTVCQWVRICLWIPQFVTSDIVIKRMKVPSLFVQSQICVFIYAQINKYPMTAHCPKFSPFIYTI